MLRDLLSKAPSSMQAALDQSDLRIVCLATAGDEWAEMMVIDTVGDDQWGDGLTASGAINFLNSNHDKKIRLRINSPGGLVFEGLQIYNAISQHEPDVVARIEGTAFSAASMIAMAADKIEIFQNSTIGIHRAQGLFFGNSDDLDDGKMWLDAIDDALVGIYADRSGQSKNVVADMIRGKVDGTLMGADEAKELGFVDEVIDNKQRKAESKDDQSKNVTDQVKKMAGAAMSMAMAENRNRLARMQNRKNA